MTIEETLLSYVTRNLLDGDGRDLSADTDLIANRIIDSFAVLELVSFISEKFQIKVPLEDVSASNLRSVTAIAALVRSRLAT